MRYRVYFQTQQPIEFWARHWEMDKYDTTKIRAWGGEDKSIPSVDIYLHETPTEIHDNHSRTVWPPEKV